MRHFSFALTVTRHPLGMSLTTRATVLIAPTRLEQGDAARNIGARPTAVDLAAVAAGTDQHLRAAGEACAKIESTNCCGPHRLAPCQADQQWTGRPPGAMRYLMHIPCSGFAGGGAGKNLSGFGLAPPPSFLRGTTRSTATSLQSACSRTNAPVIFPSQALLFAATPPCRRQWRAPCFRRDTELPDQQRSGKGYRPGSYRRTSP